VEFINSLRDDHDVIERVAGSFLAFADLLASNERARPDVERFVRFFTEFAGHYHHAREEATLFPALVERAELPVDGPIAALMDDHRRLAALLESARQLLVDDDGSAGELGAPGNVIREYVYGLWQHIDAENSVLLPESEARLRKHGLRALDGRAATAGELAARDDGVALIARYPPVMDAAGLVRGAGCVCCPLMTVTCGGLEQAWWSEHEWEEFQDHLGSD
jgi:hemerythrin-like domain-containing protein